MRPVAPLFVLLIWCAPSITRAGDFVQCFVHSVVTDTKRNNCWPQPFIYPDRASVRAPLVIMVENGWRRQNMLGEHHFDGSGTALSAAGKLKVKWVLTETPEQHRIVYVHRAETSEKTAARIAAVQELATGLVPAGERVAIVESSVSPGGWPAERVDAIGRKFQSSTPEPRLSKPQGETSSSSSK
jgi:hypothetical protein